MDGADGEMFTCDNGNEVPADYVDDGDNDCGDWSDEPNHSDNGDDEVSGCTDMYAINYDAGATNDDGSCYYEDSHDGHDDNGNDGIDDDGAPTADELINMTDTDDSGTMSFDEFIAFMNSPDPDGDELPQSVKDDLAEIFNSSDLDESGDLDLDELEQFLLAVDDYYMALEGDEEVSGCTDMYAINYDAGATNDDGSCYYEDSQAPTADELINMTDTDDSGTMSFDEFIAFMNLPDPDGGEEDDESLPQSMVDDLNVIFDNNDADMSGDLDVDELDQFILDTDDYFMSMDGDDGEMFTCENGDEVPADYVDDGYNDCGDWSDEPNHNDTGDDGMDDGHDDNGNDGHNDHGEHGSMFDWMISNSQDMPMEGSFDDYTIILAMCTMDESSDDEMDMGMGMGTTPTMNCSDDVLSVTIAEALTQDAVVMFHDVDMSGTISGGDMVHINPDFIGLGDWNMVRLYSTSADAYSDENPMLTPGFTGALGMLALLGAALLTRRD